MEIKNAKFIFVIIILLGFSQVFAQVDSGIKRFTPINANETYAIDTSGDGRFIVIESNGNIATHNPRNSDNNTEIFLMDVAQRHIFQITDSKSATQSTTCPQEPRTDIKVLIHNADPMISNDGKWIVFSSNATTSVPGSAPNGTNPSNFDANPSATTQILQQDGNLELWVYQIPAYQTVDLSTGEVPPFVNLAGGALTQITNTPASRLPVAGACAQPPSPPNQTVLPVIAVDNREGSIDDDGATIAFVSNRDLVPPGNQYPSIDNDEVFVYKRQSGIFAQVSQTPRGSISFPVYNFNPTISGDGLSISFGSNGTNSIRGMTGGSNTDFSEEVYYATLDGDTGVPNGIKRQVTNIATVNFSPALVLHRKTRTISRDGRYIVMSSSSRLDTTNQVGQGFANFIYDAQTNSFVRFTPYDNADSGLPNGDTFRYPRFTNYGTNSLSPSAVVFTSRMNFCADGTVPPTCTSGGFNPSTARPTQVYTYNFNNTAPTIKKISNSPLTDFARNGICLSSNSSSRIACTLNNDNGTNRAAFYFLTPNNSIEDPTILHFFTGAGGLAINGTTSEAQGLMPNMLGSVVYSSSLVNHQLGTAAQVSNNRSFKAPLQLKGISLTIDGISANITKVVNGRINFIVPEDLTPGIKAVVINHNGVVLRGSVQIIQSPQPDIVRTDLRPTGPVDYSDIIGQPYGRARILDITDPVNPKVEPFSVTTETSSGTVPTKLRLFLTGVQGITANALTIKLGDVIVPTSSITTNAVETDYPGIFTVDFNVPSQLAGTGHVPVVVTVNGVSSRTFETAPRTRFLPNQSTTTDLAVWRPGNGVWYVLDNYGQTPIYVQWGSPGDITAPGDYDGDGKTDFCIFRPATGDWWIINSSNNTSGSFHFGQSGDQVVQADYDGDRKTDFAIYRPTEGKWYIFQSSQGIREVIFGNASDKPVPADYDGDGKADIAIFRASTGEWWINSSLTGAPTVGYFGVSGDIPVLGDYDGDGLADPAIWRPSDGNWWIRNSNTGQITSVQWGNLSSDIPVQGDYDGDGRTDIAYWISTGSNAGWWHIKKSGNGQVRSEKWGQGLDIPVPAPW